MQRAESVHAPAAVQIPERVDDAEIRWIDSHCHVQEAYLDSSAQLSDVLSETAAAGVVAMVCVGTDAATSSAALAMARAVADDRSVGEGARSPVLWATVGMHPHMADRGVAEVAELARSAVATAAPVVAIGECGLDYHYDHAERTAQRHVFAAQVALARELDLALVVHTREAWDDTIDILRAERVPERTVIHCFTGGVAEARRCLDLGAHLSFSGIVTFRNADDVREAAALCPSDRLLVETDAPFLAPVPHRGRPNRPAWVPVVGAAVAAVRHEDVADLAAASVAVTRRVFDLDR